MRPLEADETLLIPEDEEHACTVCDVYARGFDDLDRVFGFRRMGDEAGTVRIQSRCHRCRKLDQQGCRELLEDLDAFTLSRHDKPGVVYVIAEHDRDLVKIGFTTAHPMDRLRSFQTACPDALTLLGFWPSDYYGERSTHHEHWDRHVRGEWFAMRRQTALDLIRERGGVVWRGQ